MSDDRTADADEAPQVYATTRHGRLSLDQIAALTPGLGSLMPIISDRFGWMAHAGKGGNWKLARYQLRKVVKLLKVGAMTRPKWTAIIGAYIDGDLEAIATAIEATDLEAFEAAVQGAVDAANRIHGEHGYGYIVYKVPEQGPAHMELGPVAED